MNTTLYVFLGLLLLQVQCNGLKKDDIYLKNYDGRGRSTIRTLNSTHALHKTDYNTQMGYSMSNVGDMNGDGYEDMYIVYGIGNGYTCIILGRPSFPDLSEFHEMDGIYCIYRHDQTLSNSAVSREADGSSGDFNGDGIDDFGFGCYRNNTHGDGCILFGNTLWTYNNPGITWMELRDLSSGTNPDMDGVHFRLNERYWDGMLVDDFDGDGTSEAIFLTFSQTKMVIFFGSAGGFMPAPRPSIYMVDDVYPALYYTMSAGWKGSIRGTGVVSTDLNGDNIGDLIFHVVNQGLMFVVYGQNASAEVVPYTLHGSYDLLTMVDQPTLTLDNMGTGKHSTTGDFNGDGANDLLVVSTSNSRYAYLMLGGNRFNHTHPDFSDSLNMTKTADVRLMHMWEDYENGLSYWNRAISVHDWNNDGYHDFILTTSIGMLQPRLQSQFHGAAVVVLGRPEWPSYVAADPREDDHVLYFGTYQKYGEYVDVIGGMFDDYGMKFVISNSYGEMYVPSEATSIGLVHMLNSTYWDSITGCMGLHTLSAYSPDCPDISLDGAVPIGTTCNLTCRTGFWPRIDDPLVNQVTCGANGWWQHPVSGIGGCVNENQHVLDLSDDANLHVSLMDSRNAFSSFAWDAGDFNGDNKTDIVFAGMTPTALLITEFDHEIGFDIDISGNFDWAADASGTEFVGDPFAGFWSQPFPTGYGFNHVLGDFDINGDGFSDLALSNPDGDGFVAVFVGNDAPFPDVGNNYDYITNHGAAELQILGDRHTLGLGASLTAIDINGDGIDDLVTSGHVERSLVDPTDRTDASYVYVIFGSTAIVHLSTSSILASQLEIAGLPVGFVIKNLNEGNRSPSPALAPGLVAGQDMGGKVSGGDFNGDGYDDILMSAQFAFGVFMGHAGLMGGIYTNQTSGFTTFLMPPDLSFYSNTSAYGVGDVDNDGCDDILVIQPATPAMTVFRAKSNALGDVLLMFGHAGTWPSVVDLKSKLELFAVSPVQGFDFVVFVQRAKRSSGFHSRAMIKIYDDFNHDGYSDFVFFDTVADSLPDMDNRGMGYLVYGGPRSKFQERMLLDDVADVLFTLAEDIASGPLLGLTFDILPDVTEDGASDLLVSIPLYAAGMRAVIVSAWHFCPTLAVPDQAQAVCSNSTLSPGTECTVTCEEDYVSFGESTVTCLAHGVWSEIAMCLPTGCSSSPCNAGSCADSLNATTLLPEYTCNCADTGYEGVNCEIDLDDCLSSPCLNSGACTDTGAYSFSCNCTNTGYEGPSCSNDVDDCHIVEWVHASSLVEPSSSSAPPTASSSSSSPPTAPSSSSSGLGATSSGVGRRLLSSSSSSGSVYGLSSMLSLSSSSSDPLVQVISSPCQNDGVCFDAGVFAVTCDCVSGWTGEFCDIDVDDCVVPDTNVTVGNVTSLVPGTPPCGDNGACTDTGTNSFTCDCDLGYTGATCNELADMCLSSPCIDGETCTTTGLLVYTCDDGASDDPCLSSPCDAGEVCTTTSSSVLYTCDVTGDDPGDVEFDPCLSAPCVSGEVCYAQTDDSWICLIANTACTRNCSVGTCINDDFCDCPEGLSGASCEINEDDCSLAICPTGSVCADGINLYTCDCIGAFLGDDCSDVFVDCATTNPCLNDGECFANANNTEYYCDCSGTFHGGGQCGEYGGESEPAPDWVLAGSDETDPGNGNEQKTDEFPWLIVAIIAGVLALAGGYYAMQQRKGDNKVRDLGSAPSADAKNAKKNKYQEDSGSGSDSPPPSASDSGGDSDSPPPTPSESSESESPPTPPPKKRASKKGGRGKKKGKGRKKSRR